MLISSKGRKVTPQGEFDSAWREYVIPDGVVGPTAITQAERTGWAITTGAIKAARGNWSLLLSTRTSQDRTYSVKVYMGDESCPREAGKLMDSVVLVSPAGPVVLMTNVKDGWKTTAYAEFVQVTRGETEARLLYPDVWLEANRPNSTEPTEYYWKRKVAPYFKTWQVRQSTELGDPAIYYREAKAMETQTGRTCFIAMKLVYSRGTWPVVVVAPSESAFRQQFPRPKDLDRMLEHNGFAVTAKGLEGDFGGREEVQHRRR
ncbi:MAG: hypothetical protein NTV52_20750 [Acidobacteria bacterium]|nr:hypothetical protein [Acidobacteriota bacterium]